MLVVDRMLLFKLSSRREVDGVGDSVADDDSRPTIPAPSAAARNESSHDRIARRSSVLASVCNARATHSRSFQSSDASGLWAPCLWTRAEKKRPSSVRSKSEASECNVHTAANSPSDGSSSKAMHNTEKTNFLSFNHPYRLLAGTTMQ